MKNDMLKMLLLLSVSGSLLALLLMILKCLLKNKFSKKWHYYMWIIVLLRMIIPMGLPINIAMNNTKADPITVNSNDSYANSSSPELNTDIKDREAPQQISQIDQNNDYSDNEYKSEEKEQASPLLEHVILSNTYKLEQYLAIIWFIICLILMGKKVLCYRQYLGLMKRTSTILYENKFIETYTDVCNSLGIKRKIPVLSNPDITSPIQIGLIKPMIILPEKQLESEAHLKYIFIHELVHYKRLDIIYKWLLQITLCIHWFNPIVYLLNREINKACELSCDEAVIKKLTFSEQRAYGDTLIRSLELSGASVKSVVSLCLVENAKFMKERLGAIMIYQKKSKIITCISIFIATILCIGAMFTVAYADTTKTNIKNEEVDNYSSNQINDFKDVAPIVNTALKAYALNGKWASADGISSNTYIKQLSEKMKWAEKIYKEKNEKFMLYEIISEEEITNTLGIRYMYDKSNVYRDMANVGSKFLLGLQDSSFSSLGANKYYERSVFYIKEASIMDLDVSYDLKEGKFGFYIVSPEGKIVFTKKPAMKYNKSISQKLSVGLWSIVTINESETGIFSGSKQIEANILPSEQSANTNNIITIDIPNTQDEIYVKSYPKYSLNKDEKVSVILNWEGSGAVLTLYTKEKYSSEDIKKLIKKGHLPLILNETVPQKDDGKDDSLSADYSYDQEDTSDQKGKTIILSFIRSDNNAIDWNNKVYETGDYYFYVIAEGDTGINNLQGKITIDRNNTKANTKDNTRDSTNNKKDSSVDDANGLVKSGGYGTTEAASKQIDKKKELASNNKETVDDDDAKNNKILGHMKQWSGSSREEATTSGIKFIAEDFTGDKINYTFKPDADGNKTLKFESMLEGDFEIYFVTSDRSIIKSVPFFSGNKELKLKNLSNDPIDIIIRSNHVSGSLTVDTVSKQEDIGKVVIDFNYKNSESVIGSGFFEAEDEQTLELKVLSNIEDGSMNLFLFDPNGKEQRVTIENSDFTKKIKLSKGKWAYNCTGFFKKSNIMIKGTIY